MSAFRLRCAGRRTRGTSMIEFALVLPLLLLMVLGTVELGLIFSRYQILMGSAREGGRVASLFRENCNPRRVKGRSPSRSCRRR